MTGLNKHTGTAVATEADHIRQSIGDIITTPVGSRVMRRNYGSIIPDLIDQPLNEHTRLRLFAATAAALMRWEPRFKLSNITLGFDAQGKAIVEVTGTLGDQTLTTTTNLQGAA